MGRKVEITVGLFMVLVICSALFLCFRVTDPTSFTSQDSYRIYAIFDNAGGLKMRSPVKIGGVVVGRVSSITLKLNKEGIYQPYVAMSLNATYDKIPSSSSLSIKTSGLLGEQFVDISLGLDQDMIADIDSLSATTNTTDTADKVPPYFQEGFVVSNTKPAIVIEDLIGKFLYGSGNSSDKDQKDNNETKE